MEVSTTLSTKAQMDYQMVCRALQGEQKAFSSLMRAYHESLYYMMLRMTNSTEDAEDMTLEAFSKAFKNLHQYSPQFAFSTWLFRIATNNCVDFIRKKKKAMSWSAFQTDGVSESSQQMLSQTLACDSPDPAELLIESQKSLLLREVIERLKPRYRVLVEMHYFQELSYEEIAEKNKLPLGTVKIQLHRARNFLFEILKQRGNLE